MSNPSHMDKTKTRTWVMVLYPEDPSHQNCISLLKQSGYDFACILHDKDTWDKDECADHAPGDPKKPHWHVVLKVKSPRYRKPLADEFYIKPQCLEPCRDVKKALLYLVHDGYDTKFQYDVNDVFGPLSSQLETLLMCDNEGERVIEIVHMIDQSPGLCTYREILLKACRAGLYGDFRKLGAGVRYLLDEHNDEIKNELVRDSKPTAGAYEKAISQAEFTGFVCGYESRKKGVQNL